MLGPKHHNDRGTKHLQTSFTNNIPAIKLLQSPIPDEKVIDALQHIFHCYRTTTMCRLQICSEILKIDSGYLIKLITSLNINNANDRITTFINKQTNKSLKYKAGVTTNKDNRMKTYRLKYNILAEMTRSENLPIESAMLFELCAIVQLKEMQDQNIIKTLNVSTGFDSS